MLLKLKLKKVSNSGLWALWGFICLILSAIIIPLLLNIVQSPWHAVRMFAPDVALLVVLTVILLALNGLLAIRISVKKRKNNF